MDSNQTNAEPVGSPIVEASSGGGGNKMVWIVVAVVVILIIGGVYFYMSSQNSAPTGQTSTQTTTQTSQVQGNLDSDLNAISVGTGEEDFSSVDADLKTL